MNEQINARWNKEMCWGKTSPNYLYVLVGFKLPTIAYEGDFWIILGNS